MGSDAARPPQPVPRCTANPLRTHGNVLILKEVPAMGKQVNIELVKKQIAALNDHNIDDYLSRIDESYVVESETLPGPVRGREASRKALEMLFAALPDLRLEIEQTLASGDFVVIRYRVSGTHRGTLAGIAATNKRVSYQGCRRG